jgi:hypothetical protein
MTETQSCPKGHGELKRWEDKYRCWKCGWPDDEEDKAVRLKDVKTPWEKGKIGCLSATIFLGGISVSILGLICIVFTFAQGSFIDPLGAIGLFAVGLFGFWWGLKIGAPVGVRGIGGGGGDGDGCGGCGGGGCGGGE